MNDHSPFKIVFMGSSNAGKSSIIEHMVKGQYSGMMMPTIGVQFFCISEKDDKSLFPLKLHIWDTCGNERFASIVKLYFRDAHIALLVFDLNNFDINRDIISWIKNFRELNDDGKIILVGNKKDIISKESNGKSAELFDVCEKYGTKYIETSATTGFNITELLKSIYTECKGIRTIFKGGIILNAEKGIKKNCCNG